MPTLNDAFNELQAINAKLQTLHADNGALAAGQAAITAAIGVNTAAVNNVRASVDAGTAVLNAMVQLQKVTNTTLLHISRQADTMICALEAIARNTCAIHNEAHVQTLRQTVIASAETALLDITRTINPGAALDLDRRMDQQIALEKCCPPDPEPQPCHYKPCPAPPPLEQHKIGEKKPG